MWKMVGIILEKQFCEVADALLGKMVRTPASYISENFVCLIEKRRRFYKNYLSDRSHENERNVKEKWRKH